MQTIYIDVLLFINFIIDFLILDITKIILSINVKYRNILLGSAISSVFSLIILIPSNITVINMFVSVIITALIVFLTYGKCSVSIFVKRMICFISINIIFAGIIIGIYSFNKFENIIICNGTFYFDISPILLIILTILCYIILYIGKRILGKKIIAERICRITAVLDGNSYIFNAKVDTGCDLREPFSNKPVIVAEKSIFSTFNINNKPFRLVPFNSLGGEGVLKAVKLDKLYIDNTFINKEIYVGFCENILKSDVKALISNDIIGDE